MVRIGEHYRPTSGKGAAPPVPPGVYRVVGTGDPVVLLRVGDADGRRVHTGELTRIDADALTDGFESAADPDAGFEPLRGVKNAFQGIYWQFRRFI